MTRTTAPAATTPLGLTLAATLALLWAAPTAWAGTVQVTVLDAAGKPLPEAVVFLESAEARARSRPLAEAQIGQQDKRFQPTVSVVQVGTAVHFPNRDTVRHHVYSFSPTKTFELKLYIGTPAKPVVFDQPGVAVLGCNIHDTMVGWVLVLETPHHARSGADGRARLLDVPAGSYRLRAWHPDLPVGSPASDQPIQVRADPVQADVALRLGHS